MAESDKGVSLVICCYNSQERIVKTLEHAIAQELDAAIPFEIIVVDNACTDETALRANAVLAASARAQQYAIVQEPEPGLSNARRTGIEQARYEYIIFCDDDNWLAPNYAAQVWTIFSQMRQVGIVGGRGEGVLEIEPPSWFARMEKSYAIGKQARESGEIGVVWGAGMGIRRSAYLRLLALGFRNLNTDRIRERLTGGGDTEICLAIRRLGFTVWYDERLVFQHWIPAERISKDYVRQLCYYIGYTSPTFSAYSVAFSPQYKSPGRYTWMGLLVKSFTQWLVLCCRPAKSAYFKDPRGELKYFFLESYRGRLARHWEMGSDYGAIVEGIRRARWNQ